MTTSAGLLVMIGGVTPGDLLRAWRLKAGLSQEAMAAQGGMARTQFSDYEADRSSPTIRTLLRFIALIEQAHGPLGDSEDARLARFFLGPKAAGRRLFAGEEVMRRAGRRR